MPRRPSLFALGSPLLEDSHLESLDYALAQELFESALSCDYGVIVSDTPDVEQLRRKLYEIRRKMRDEGIEQYDQLALLAKKSGLWIVKQEYVRDE